MTAIFLSHSSKDNGAAATLSERLNQRGHRSIFLDFDPAKGIPAGRDWEEELYSRLRACRVVIVLCSPASMRSKWCFAEVTHAKSLGKPVIPVKVADCKLNSVLATLQMIDLTTDPDQGLVHLLSALDREGIDSRAQFDWDSDRPPYPGLSSFSERDAAVYFGRDNEVQEAIETCSRLRHLGGRRLTMILGPSGSGKSSFVRAGLVPHLALKRDDWLIVPPFRPLSDPLRELAGALAQAFRNAGSDRNWSEFDSRLRQSSGSALIDVATDLREAAGQLESTVLLVVDQFEECFTATHEASAALFRRELTNALSQPDRRLMAIATMRSDFLSDLQTCDDFVNLDYDTVELKPMSQEGMTRVIEGPAEVSALRLERGLVKALLEDTKTSDALPLLAFTLRELWEKYGDDNFLELREYREGLGSLEAAIARTAESVLIAHPFDTAQELLLRKAFLAMVRVNDEGQYGRQRVFWDDVSLESREWLERFVKVRLLVSNSDSGQRTVEVAHEALFRSWERLRAWLAEERDYLLWRQRLRTRIEDWKRAQRDPGELLRGTMLVQAKHWVEDEADLTREEMAYIQASTAHEATEDAKSRRRSRALRSVLAAAAVITLVAAFTGIQWYQANRSSTAMRLVSEAGQMLSGVREGGDIQALQMLLAAKALGATTAEDVANTRRDEKKILENASLDNGSPAAFDRVVVSSDDTIAARSEKELVFWGRDRQARSPIALDVQSADPEVREWGLAFSPEGKLLATGSGPHNATLQLWDVETGKARESKQFDAGVLSVAFSPDGRRIVVGCVNGAVEMWDRSTGETVHFGGHKARVYMVAFSPNGQWIASVAHDNTSLKLWDPRTPLRAIASTVETDEKSSALSMAFAPAGDRLVLGRYNGQIEVRDVPTLAESRSTGEQQHPIIAKIGKTDVAVYDVAFDSTGSRIVSGDADKKIRVWDSELHPIGPELTGHHGDVKSVAFDQGGTEIVSGGADGTVRIWDALNGMPIPDHQGETRAVAFGRDAIVSGGVDGTMRLWNPLTGQELNKSLGGPPSKPYDKAVNSLTLLPPEESKVVVGSHDGAVRIWDIATGHSDPLPFGDGERATGQIRSVAVDPSGKFIAAGGDDGVVRLWSWDGQRAHLIGERPTSTVSGERYAISTVAFSPKGNMFATGSSKSDSSVQFWNTSPMESIGQTMTASSGANVYEAAFDNTGDRMVTGTYDGLIEVWDVKARRAIKQLSGDRSIPLSVAFAHNGSLIVSGSDNGTIRIWSGEDYSPIGGPLTGHEGWVLAVAFNPNDTAFVSSGRDGMIHLWPRPPSMKVSVCSKIDGPMTKAEWNRWVSPWIFFQQLC